MAGNAGTLGRNATENYKLKGDTAMCDEFVPYQAEGNCEMCGRYGQVWVDEHPEIGLMGFCQGCWAGGKGA